MTRASLRLGFSPCPNDTFMFHALVHGRVVVPGVDFVPMLGDIEELNLRAEGPDPLPITKLSVGALARVCDRYSVLSSGAALGRGVGPLVVAAPGSGLGGRGIEALRGRRIGIPGARTTANLLLGLLAPNGLTTIELRFDRILAAVAAREIDAGVIIHESRFTYRAQGLELVADLGALWESETGLPLPLGVIAASRDLPKREVTAIDVAVRSSVQHALLDPTASRSYVRDHAQEMSQDVCAQHIALYVNERSVELGDEGRRAVDSLLDRGRERGLLPGERSPWR